VSTDAYLDAKAAFENIENKVRDMSQTLINVGGAINRQPGRFIFSNCDLGLPMEASMSRDSISVDANQWKTPKQIQEMLAEWHKLKDAMHTAWQNVPAARREGLKPPPAR
jgi:hypothetical protein